MQQAMRDDEVYWRLIYGFPIILDLVSLLCVLVYFREPSIIDLVQAESDEATTQIKRVYRDVEDCDAFIQQLRRETSKENSSVGICSALSDKRYRVASWNAIILGWSA